MFWLALSLLLPRDLRSIYLNAKKKLTAKGAEGKKTQERTASEGGPYKGKRNPGAEEFSSPGTIG
jgi:hypothetical protein